MRTTAFCLALLSISLFAGCNSSGDEIRAYALEAQQILDRLDAYQRVVEDLAEEIKREGLASPDQLAAVSKINGAIDDLKNRLGKIAAAIGNTEFSDEHTMVNSLTAMRVASTVAGTYPYSGHVSVALLALTGIVGLWGKNQLATRKLAEDTTAIIVKSIAKAEDNGIVKLDDVKQDKAIERVVSEIRAA